MRSTGRLAPLARVLHLPSVRRAELGFLAFSVAEHSTWLAVLVFALQRGGVREVGVVMVVMLLPAIVLAPFAAYAGDRFPPQHALAVGYAAQAVTMAGTAVAMTAEAPVAAYALSAAAAMAVSFTRPVMGTLLPGLTHAPADLVAANVIANVIEQVGVFAGPLLAAVLLAVGSPSSVFAAGTALVLVASIAVVGLRDVAAPEPDPTLTPAAVVRQMFAGFRTVSAVPLLRLLVAVGVAVGLLRGITDVITVTFTAERLDGGDGLVGLVGAAYGVGAMVGVASASRSVSLGRTTRTLVTGALLASVPMIALAGVGSALPTMLAFGVMGAGETVITLSVSVAVQRGAPQGVLSRVFGVLEGLMTAALALGSIAVTALTTGWSLGAALVTLGLALLVLVGTCALGLRRRGGDPTPLDDDVVERLLLDPVLAPLAAPIVERLARLAEPRGYDVGQTAVRQGADGDHYHLIVSGTADVLVDGVLVNRLGPGDSFGEMALLREQPRAATVLATTPLCTLAIERDDFLEAVTRNQRSHGAATVKIDSHVLGS